MKTIITQEEIKKIRATAEELDELEEIKPIFLNFIYRALSKELFPETHEAIALLDDKCIECIEKNEDETMLGIMLDTFDELKTDIFKYGFNMGYIYGTTCNTIK